jgi:cytoskeletal protein RodZ
MRPTHIEGRVLSKGFLTLIAILLAFILVLVFIWVWYDLRLTALDKNTGNQNEIPSANQ